MKLSSTQFRLLIAIGLFLTVTLPVSAQGTQRPLPDRLGDFRALGRQVESSSPPDQAFGIISTLARRYEAPDGSVLLLEVTHTRSASAAYSLLTLETGESQKIRNDAVGIASIVAPDHLSYFQNSELVRVTGPGSKPEAEALVFELARRFEESLDTREGEVPVLVRHLPQWEIAQQQVFYATTSNALKQRIRNYPIVDELRFDGGTEAVLASYGPARFLLVEFTTPQFATDNDNRVLAKLQTLQTQGLAKPTAYRRVGNYLVFVFDAATEEAANALIDQVKYEQVVQWLGDNPYAFAEAQRRYTETTAGVLIAVVKASGLSLLGCLIFGGLVGALMFSRRRNRQRAVFAFSDAGGMLRLNLDDMTPEQAPRKLLGPQK